MRIIRCEYDGRLFYGRFDGDNVVLSCDIPKIRIRGGKRRSFGKLKKNPFHFHKYAWKLPVCLKKQFVSV